MRVDTSHKKPVYNWASSLDAKTLAQVHRLADMPFIHHHVALMPDAHFGKGSTIGSVIATKGAIIPSCAGVDLGCGMTAQPLGFPVDRLGGDGRLRDLRLAIEQAVPVGFAHHQEPVAGAEVWAEGTQLRVDRARNARMSSLADRAGCQLGTLGGGNHFIEICRDQADEAWLMLHSGSRGMGNTLANHHIHRARDEMKRYFIDLPDPDLAYFVEGTQDFQDYIGDMHFAQDYARANREAMMRLVIGSIERHLGAGPLTLPEGRVSCHHNYTAREHHFGANVWLTRKGAVSARKGEKGIIPGSMGTRSYIVEGLGSAASFQSCAHGAGRAMGRNEAKKRFTVSDLVSQTMGVECRKDEGVLDELPQAYKEIDVVMADQVDLVKTLHVLRAIICVKG